jgi:hypothetical protein
MAVDAFGAWWGGLPCALEGAPPTYQRARGLEAAVATVAMPRSYFSGGVAPEVPAEPFKVGDVAIPSEPIARMGDTVPATFSAVQRPPFVADLVIAQGETRFVARHMYLVDARIVDPQNKADESGFGGPLVEFTLASIVRFWDDYGEVTKVWNEGLAKGQAVVLGPDGQPRVRPDDRVFVAHTAKAGGTKATPLREIVQALLNALPGELQVVSWPADTPGDTVDEQVFEVHAWGASPKRVLAAVLEAAQLVVDVGEDLGVRVYRLGAGDVGERDDAGNLAPHDPQAAEGAWAGQITEDGDRYTRRVSGRPREVVVIGDRTVYEVAVDNLTPVLCVDAERPDGPPERLVVEVTPDNLQAFARGAPFGSPPVPAILTSADERVRIKTIIGLSTPTVADAEPIVLPEGAQTGPAAAPLPADGHLWQRLPLENEDTWAASLPHLSERVRTLLRQQLWRYYKVPDAYRRLLPILNRAARDYKGDRLGPKCEAFGYRTVSARVPVRPEDEPTTNDSGAPNEARLERVRKLEVTQKAIAQNEALLKRLDGPSYKELKMGFFRGVWGGWSWIFGNSNDEALRQDMEAANAALEPVMDGWARMGSSWWSALGAGLSTAADRVGFESLANVIKDEAAMFGGETQQDAEVLRRNAEESLAALRAEERRLIHELNPRIAKEQELAALEVQIRGVYAAGGFPSTLLGKRDAVVAELAALRDKKNKDVAEGKDRHPKQPETEEWIYHTRLMRHEVPFRVVDEALGIIEVLGESLPVWLADSMAPDPKATWIIPMPVKLTFGSWNGRDVDGATTGAPQVNRYIGTSLTMIGSDFADMARFMANFGDRVPPEPGEEQVRFTFTRGDQESGRAKVSKFAWRVLYEDPENPLRRLVLLPSAVGQAAQAVQNGVANAGLPSTPTTPDEQAAQALADALLATTRPLDNWDELLARARPVAQAALSAPDEIDSGSLVVRGPRAAALSGRASAVHLTLRDVNEGFQTEVSFASDAAPLPGIQGSVRQEGPTRLVFGLDVAAGRDA